MAAAFTSTLFLEFLSEKDGVSLYRTAFFHAPTGRTHSCARGYTLNPTHGNFRWGPATHALSVLALRHSLRRFRVAEGEEAYELIGERGSLAASLDFAISKQPNWVLDMFGVLRDGTPVVKKIVTRVNSERKRPGPVRLSLHAGHLPAEAVKIDFDGAACTSEAALRSLLEKLESGYLEKPAKVFVGAVQQEGTNGTNDFRSDPPVIPHFDQQLFQQQLRAMFRREAAAALHLTDIFSPSGASNAIRDIHENSSFAKIIRKKDVNIVSDLDRTLYTSDRLGLLEDTARQLLRGLSEPLTVALSPNLSGTVAILKYLQTYEHIPLTLDMHFPHTLEIVDRIVAGKFEREPDLCALGIGPSARLLSHRPRTAYRPLMLLPKVSQRIVAPKGSAGSGELQAGRYLFMTDTPSGATFYFEGLETLGLIDRKRVKVDHLEPHDVPPILAEADEVKSILWFPHYELNRLYNGCVLVDEIAPGNPDRGRISKSIPRYSYADTILFAHERVFKQERIVRAFDTAVRHAWLELRDGGDCFEYIMESIVSDPRFVTSIKRFSGLHLLTSRGAAPSVERPYNPR